MIELIEKIKRYIVKKPTVAVYTSGVILVSIGASIKGASVGWTLIICGAGALIGALFMYADRSN